MKNELAITALIGCAFGFGAMNGCGADNAGADDPSSVETTSGALFVSTCATTGKSATASTGALQPAANAIDGNNGTRWESVHGVDSQFIQLDLGVSMPLTGVTITWETACGKDYDIQTAAATNGPWTTVANVRGNTKSGVANPVATTFTQTARFVRMNGIHRCTQYGYSIWEFQVNTTTLACNVDKDHDGFGAPYIYCGGCTDGNIASSNDCNDSTPSANPNQTAFFTSQMTFPNGGNPSWDWNCDGTIEAQGTDGSYYFCATAAGVKVSDCSQCAYNWIEEDASDCNTTRCSLDGGNVHVGCH